jgi:hypothetical protein
MWNGRKNENLRKKTTAKAVEIDLKSRSNKMEVAERNRAKWSPTNEALNLNSTGKTSSAPVFCGEITDVCARQSRVGNSHPIYEQVARSTFVVAHKTIVPQALRPPQKRTEDFLSAQFFVFLEEDSSDF